MFRRHDREFTEDIWRRVIRRLREKNEIDQDKLKAFSGSCCVERITQREAVIIVSDYVLEKIVLDDEKKLLRAFRETINAGDDFRIRMISDMDTWLILDLKNS